jgi:TRAP-type mannitol/chloroaromatic compound transport system permease large subunit
MAKRHKIKRAPAVQEEKPKQQWTTQKIVIAVIGILITLSMVLSTLFIAFSSSTAGVPIG